MFDIIRLSQYILAESSGHGEEGGAHHVYVNIYGLFFYIALAIIIVGVTATFAKKGLNTRYFTNKLTQYYEQLYYFVESLCVGIIGAHGRKYMPMVFTFWLMIFVSNVLALMMPTAPTANLSFNVGIALIAIGYVQYEGIRANGFFGHFAHFAGPKMGLALIPINLMIFVIEIISEAMKNVSLSLRLFGNIDGGHQAAVAMNHLGDAIYVPVGAFLMPIKLLTCVVQALIFCLLFCVYLSLVTHHDEDHGHDHGHEGTHEPTPASA